MEEIELRPHHIQLLRDYYHGRLRRLKMKIVRIYGQEFTEEMLEFFRGLTDNPNRRVKIVERLDSLCNYGSKCGYRYDCKGRRSEKIKKMDEKTKLLRAKALRVHEKFVNEDCTFIFRNDK